VIDKPPFEQRLSPGGVEEMINLQRDGGAAKPHQVRQVRAVILRNRLVEVE